ncbi:MAG: NAD(P)-dependent oxidoreductase [Verrucomicrobiales bacterium]
MKTQKVGFVGVGRMGANMARCLAEKGFTVSVVYDARMEAASELAQELGCARAEKLADVTALADVILTVVTDDAAMKTILAPDGDSLLIGAAGRTFIHCATVSPESHEGAEAAANSVGAHTLAASMASSITQARMGTLYLMVGGKAETFEAMKPLLEALSQSLRHVGPVGDAARFKALVNMVMNINTAGLAEGLGLGAALGLDLKTLKEVFSQTGANSRVLETDGDDMIQREHDCFFSAAHAAKDSGIANALAVAKGVETPLSLATENQYRRLIDFGRGQLDKSAVAELTFPGRQD